MSRVEARRDHPAQDHSRPRRHHRPGPARGRGGPVGRFVRHGVLPGRLRRIALHHRPPPDRIVDGIIQAGANSYSSATGGVSSSFSGVGGANGGTAIGGSTAIGNSLNVVVQGNHNTVIVNSTQTNNGNVTAGTSLNGTLRLP